MTHTYIHILSSRHDMKKEMLAKCAHILQFANRKEPVREHMTGMAQKCA